jgi:ABC-type protease/lipase transport system fused ATPase/permease subunit
MNWLLSPPIRPCVALAALASLLLNPALLAPALYMLQVFDRVFASRSLETLLALSAFAALALLLAGCMDRARALLLARAGRTLDETLAPLALEAWLADSAVAGGRVDRSAMQDVARLRAFLAGPAVQALFDAPWLPLYLLVIFALHPLLGVAATASALLMFGGGLQGLLLSVIDVSPDRDVEFGPPPDERGQPVAQGGLAPPARRQG